MKHSTRPSGLIKSSLRLERPKGISGDYHQASRVNIHSGIEIKTERFRVIDTFNIKGVDSSIGVSL